MVLDESQIISAMRSSGYKLTPQRLAVVRVITGSQIPLTPAMAYKEVSTFNRAVGLVTVYRTLEVLTALHLVCRVRTGSGESGFLLKRSIEHHHHLICTYCGRVTEICECNLGNLLERLPEETGFTPESHLLDFYGRCKDCQAAAK